MESNALASNNRPPQPFVQRDDDDEIDLLKLWNTIWRRKWSIIALTLVVAMITVLMVLNVTPIYRAMATLLIEQNNRVNVVSIEQVYGLDGKSNEYLQTQFELLKSRTLAERVVKELGLVHHPEFDPTQQEPPLLNIPGWIGGLALNNLLPGIFPAEPEIELAPSEEEIFASVVRQFMGRISVQPQGN